MDETLPSSESPAELLDKVKGAAMEVLALDEEGWEEILHAATDALGFEMGDSMPPLSRNPETGTVTHDVASQGDDRLSREEILADPERDEALANYIYFAFVVEEAGQDPLGWADEGLAPPVEDGAGPESVD